MQVTYLGYQNTTGMTAMDYRLTDAHADPPGTTDAFYTEKLVRLPGSFFCYRPPETAPEVNELPALASGRVTLGWLNFLAKTTPEAIRDVEPIAEGRAQLRNCLCWLIDPECSRSACSTRSRQRGVDPARVEIVNWRPPDAYLRLHHRIDIALDSFPFNGHTTICNALWMGVPSVVRQGTSYASRFGGSALVNLGLEDLIARSDEEYVEIVARLAAICRGLAELRRGLRARVAGSSAGGREDLHARRRTRLSENVAQDGAAGPVKPGQDTMTTIPEAVEMGLAHHRAGQLQQAESIYRQVLQANPQHAVAAHLWGLVALQVGRFDLAVERISVAVRLDGGQAAFHVNLGAAYRGLGRLAEARQCYEQALRLQPDLAEAQNNLGTMLQSQGKLAEAIALYQKAIAKKPNYADAHNNLGTAFQEQGDWPRAIACYRSRSKSNPAMPAASTIWACSLAHEKQFDGIAGRIRTSRGDSQGIRRGSLRPGTGAARAAANWPEAEAAYREALRLRPNMAEAACSLGTLQQAQNHLDAAVEMYQEALRQAPEHAEAYYNWGTALKRQQRVAEAAEKYRQAIRCQPTMADAHYNLGTVLQELGDRRTSGRSLSRGDSTAPRHGAGP